MRKPRKITVQTVELIKSRTIECGDCWEWQGYIGNGSPQVSHAGKMVTVRGILAQLLGKPLASSLFWSAKCGNPKCVNPEHLIGRNKRQHALFMNAQTNYKDPILLSKMRKAAQSRSKITPEIAEVFRTDPRQCRELAREYGVSHALVSRVRRGKAWVQPSNVWAGLMR